MVLLEDLLGAVQVELVVGALAPGQLGDPLQVGADDLVLRGLGRRPVEPAQLALDFVARGVAQLQLGDPVAQLVRLVALALLAELLADLLHLLAQKHLALALAEFLLDLGLDVLVGIDPHQLPLDRHQRGPHPVLVAEGFEQLLLLGRRQLQVEGHEVGKRAGLVDSLDQLVQRFGRHTAPGPELGGPFPQFLVECLEPGVLLVGRSVSVDRDQGGLEHRLAVVGVLDRAGARLPLNEELDAAANAVGLDDSNDRADRIQDPRIGIVLILVLCDGKEPPVSVERLLDRLDRSGAPR